MSAAEVAPDGGESADGSAGATADMDQRIEVLGEASPEQVAALVAVLSGLGGAEEEPAAPPSRWAAPSRQVRATLHPSPGGWRASALPR